MTVRAFLARAALALLLVFAQQQAVLHELRHGVDAVEGKAAPVSPHDACIKCLSFAGFDHSPASSPPALELPEAGHMLAAAPAPESRAADCCRAYRSRAPPLPA